MRGTPAIRAGRPESYATGSPQAQAGLTITGNASSLPSTKHTTQTEGVSHV